MSSMEVDVPTPINGLADQPPTVDVLKQRVQFSEHNEVKVISSIEMRPKHKARRRARLPKVSLLRNSKFESMCLLLYTTLCFLLNP